MPRAVEVTGVVEETPSTTSIEFKLNPRDLEIIPRPQPGQFLMVWIPGVDEIPLSVSDCIEPGTWQVTVKNVGEATSRLVGVRRGDKLGIRGPFGNGFTLKGKAPIICGGGVGMAPLLFLVKKLLEVRPETRPVVIIAATTSEELLFQSKLLELEGGGKIVLECSTDDGSFGYCGMANECLESVLNSHENADVLYTCGPEKMMASLLELSRSRGLEFQASLERVMRCGMGLCGLCVCDPAGVRVCKEGPVFSGELLSKLDDFGRYKREMTGRKVPL
ncbi:MAG: dihydroorotate dehydrogenase electron transfer subunit [Promethearchaeota archaeon]